MTDPAQSALRKSARAASPGHGSGRGSDLRTSGLLLITLGLAVGSLHTVLGGLQWWLSCLGVASVVLGAGALTRLFLRTRWSGTAAAFITSVVLITWLFGRDTAVLGLIPTSDSWLHFALLIADGNESIAKQSIPAQADGGILFLLCLAIAGLAVLLDALAIWRRMPALAGIPLLVVMTVPTIVRPDLGDVLLFTLAAITYLLLLRPRVRRIQGSMAAALGSIAITAAITVPLVLPTAVPEGPVSGAVSVSAGLNPMIALGADLRRGTETTALNYRTTSTDGLYLRLTTLDDFRGSQWSPVRLDPIQGNGPDEIGPAEGLGDKVETVPVTSTVLIDSAAGPWLPVPYPATSVTGLQGEWFWEPDGLSVRSATSDMRNQQYQVSSLDVQPTAQQLRNAADSSASRLAQVPKGLDPLIAETALEVVGDAATDYEKAIALQEWFRGEDFEYSLDTPVEEGFDGSGLDALVPFLEAKTGYCVHFASAMAVMARTLGIPARIAVGFLPGSPVPGSNQGDFRVSSHDLHSWPELYFAGTGWVRFEPTSSLGIVPDFGETPVDDPQTPDVDESESTATATATPSATPSAPSSLAPAPETSDPADASTTDAWWTALGVVLGFVVGLLLLLSPALVRAGIRARRFRQIRLGRSPKASAWRELAESARDLGLSAPPGSTPRQLAESLAAEAGLGGTDLDSLNALRTAVEDEAFARPAGRVVDASAAPHPAARHLRTVLYALRRRSHPVALLSGTLLPRTLIDRLLALGANRR